MKKGLLMLAGLLVMLLPDLQSQTLQKAVGGNGMYKESIWWLDFEGIELAAGGSTTQTYDINGLYTLVVTINNISFGGNLVSSRPLSSQRLIGYKSGTYGGDGLVKLYNIGVTNNGGSISDRAKNKLYNALSLKYDGNYGGSPNEAKANFKVTAHAYLNGSLDPIDVGLIFADAETDEPASGSTYREYSQGTTNGSAWQVFETALHDNGGRQRVDISNNGLTAKTICGFNGSEWAPGNVVLMYTKKVNTTLADPLKVDMEFMGGGRTATAVGFLLTSVDKGDAPESYGIAENIFFTTVVGGTPSADGSYYISNTGTFGGTPVLPVGELNYLSTPRLGNLAGDPDEYTAVANIDANLDNTTDANDEDAISVVPVLNTRSDSYSLTFEAVPTPGQDAYVNAWVDFNVNGMFDTEEFQSVVVSTAGTVTLNWTGIAPQTGISYLRLRIQSNVPGIATGSYDVKMGGEVEDYRLDITTFISGNVFHDANGLYGTPLNTVDGIPVSMAGGEQLYVSLLDAGNSLIAQVPVNADGTYEFENVRLGNYSLVLTATINGSIPDLPATWMNTGEYIGVGTGSDATVDGMISISIGQGDPEVTNANFGAQQPPLADPKQFIVSSSAFSVAPPADFPAESSFRSIPLSSSSLVGYETGGSLSGSDPEDCATAGACNTGTGTTFTIHTINSNTKLYYDFGTGPVEIDLTGGPVTIQGFDVDKMVLYAEEGSGETGDELGFTYSITDAAGAMSDPVSYSIITSAPLSVDLILFEAFRSQNTVILNWLTASENENEVFEIEHSINANQWNRIGKVQSKAEAGNVKHEISYQFIDNSPAARMNYYRLKQIGFNGNATYTAVRQVMYDVGSVITLHPNPVEDNLVVSGLTGAAIIRIYNIVGQLIKEVNASDKEHVISMSAFEKGIYIIRISTEDGAVFSKKVVKNK